LCFKIAASWGVSQKDSGGAPQLKGARNFSFTELRNCTNNFSDTHEIGSGGYGKVSNKNNSLFRSLKEGLHQQLKQLYHWT
jgi:hypothetical protein